MKEILETLIKSLVDNQEEVTITEKEEGKTTVFEVKVSETDMGKVIGKQGRIAKAIRTVSKAIATKENKKVNIINGRKEFFKVSLDEIEKVVRENHEKLIEFNENADAEQYRETLKIKEKFYCIPIMQKIWFKL